jgi:hypothetical protein
MNDPAVENTAEMMDLLADYEPIGAELVPLLPDQIDTAIAMSQSILDPEKRWPVYLNALAIAGFEQWLHQRTTGIRLNQAQCRILEPETWQSKTAVYHLQANGLRLCLIAIDTVPDEIMTVPTIALDHPEWIAQFYIPIHIYEEAEQVSIQGFLRYDEWVQHRQTQPLQASPSGVYAVPTAWFNADLDQLLLYLSCLDPAAIPLPVTAPAPSALPLRQLLIQPVVNAGRWIQQQLEGTADRIIAELSWHLLPPINFSIAIRETLTNLNQTQDQPTEAFIRILTALVRGGLPIPDQSRTAYQDFQLADQALRLYTMIAPIASTAETPEWSLLVVLCAQGAQTLPEGSRLTISDGIEVIAEPAIAPSAGLDYLYTSVIGDYDEQFITTVSLADGNAMIFPPFVFHPDPVQPSL